MGSAPREGKEVDCSEKLGYNAISVGSPSDPGEFEAAVSFNIIKMNVYLPHIFIFMVVNYIYGGKLYPLLLTLLLPLSKIF